MTARSLFSFALSLLCLASAAHAQAVVFNDNFDSGSFAPWGTPLGENAGATIQIGGGISGSNYALINGNSNDVLGHGLGPGNGLTDWVLEFDFQLAPAGDTGRYFNLHIGAAATSGAGVSVDAGSASINLRYQQDEGSEGFDVYTGTTKTWVSLRSELGALDRDEWHHLRIEGFGWGTPDFTYTITLTPAGESTRTTSGLTFFQNGNPKGSPMDGFNFNRGFGFPSDVNFGVDNVVLTAVPEPSTAAALLAGAGLLGFRRRRIA